MRSKSTLNPKANKAAAPSQTKSAEFSNTKVAKSKTWDWSL